MPRIPEAPQTSEPQVSLPQPCSLYASTVPEDAVKPIPVNITSGAGSTVPSDIVKFGNGLFDKKTSTAMSMLGEFKDKFNC
jgi:hypothetical protein